jgi:two-component system, NtrC family, response regulator AtoC
VLESRSFVRVGGSCDIPSDVRVIAATNRHPEQAVRAGTLRADLYYRLAEFPINVPPLRERDGDIAPLSKHFLHRLNTRFRTHKAFAADALTYLSERAWPGNVRELKHAVQRGYVVTNGDTVSPSREMPFADYEASKDAVQFRVGMTFQDVEREMLLRTLAACGYNKRRAARVLGITSKTIYNRLAAYREMGLITSEQLGQPDSAEE